MTEDKYEVIPGVRDTIDALTQEVADLKVQREFLLMKMVEISKGEGRYSRDRLEHCEHCVEDMIAIAKGAVKTVEAMRSDASGEHKDLA